MEVGKYLLKCLMLRDADLGIGGSRPNTTGMPVLGPWSRLLMLCHIRMPWSKQVTTNRDLVDKKIEYHNL